MRQRSTVLREYRPEVIVHFAALIEVGQSVKDPTAFFENNVAGTLSLLAAAEDAGIGRLVFSSTCATYGMPEAVPMDETHSQLPINPYGRSKLFVEQMLGDLDRYKGFRSVVLRYFNAAGADPEGRIGEWHSPETHAIPLAIEAALGRRRLQIFGADYDTRARHCVRDFVHVMDSPTSFPGGPVSARRAESVALNLAPATTVRNCRGDRNCVRKVSGRNAERREGDRRRWLPTMPRQIRSRWMPSHDLGRSPKPPGTGIHERTSAPTIARSPEQERTYGTSSFAPEPPA